VFSYERGAPAGRGGEVDLQARRAMRGHVHPRERPRADHLLAGAALRTTSQKCEAVSKRARTQGSETLVSLNFRLEGNEEEDKTPR